MEALIVAGRVERWKAGLLEGIAELLNQPTRKPILLLLLPVCKLVIPITLCHFELSFLFLLSINHSTGLNIK